MHIIVITIIIAVIIAAFILIPQLKCMDPVPKGNMSEWQQEVSDKLERDSLKKFEDNLWNNVCPLCKKDMELHTYGTYDQFSDHWCIHCGFITKC